MTWRSVGHLIEVTTTYKLRVGILHVIDASLVAFDDLIYFLRYEGILFIVLLFCGGSFHVYKHI